MKRLTTVFAALGTMCLMFALARVAEAHSIGASGADFTSGLTHPFIGLDHLVAMIAVGLWAVQIAERSDRMAALWAVPGAFLTMMCVGAGVAIAGFTMPRVELGVIGSLVVLGGLLVLAPRLPVWAGMAIAGVFALFHGHAHGLELPEDASALFYAAGFAVSTAALHAVGVALGFILHQTVAARTAMRVGGAAVAALGIFIYIAG